MKAMILCGGMGTRLKEETEYKPKPMVEIGGRPILWHIMKQYAFYGYNEFILALGFKGDVIRNYFLNYHAFNNDFTIHLGKHNGIEIHSNHSENDWKVTLVETGANSMTGYRVKLAGKYVDTDQFMLTYGDAVSDVNIEKLVDFHKQKRSIGTVTGVFPPSRFGELKINGTMVEIFKEKPVEIAEKSPINGGYFVFEKSFLNTIPDDPTCDLEKEPLEKLATQNQLKVFKHVGFWQCMDTYRDYLLLNKLWNENPKWKIWNEDK